jgi:glutamine amidotransferase
VARSTLVILPGVGSAVSAVKFIQESWLDEALRRRHAEGRPIIGICLGAQLMYEYLEESRSAGLSWLSGSVHRLPHGQRNTGWSALDHQALRDAGLAKGLRAADTVYFNHRFELPRSQTRNEVLATGLSEVVAIANQNNLYAIQFHPEKSQSAGVQILKNVLGAARAN